MYKPLQSLSVIPAASPVAGIDEVGRGPLAGPVVAAAVVLAPGQAIGGVRDSKLLSAPRRLLVAERIRAEALDWALGEASHREIDELNILGATLLAMRRAFQSLRIVPGLVEIDGNRVPELPGYPGIVSAVIGGDRLRVAIGAASILAKVHRDDLMTALHGRHPAYGFDRHKGYPTAEHRTALRALGPCPEHRRSFAPVRAVLGRAGSCP